MKEFLTILFILGAGQGIFIGIALLFKKPQIISNKFFSLFIILFSLYLILAIYELKTNQKISTFHVISFPVLFLFGPLFYFYVGTLTSAITKFRKIHLLHLLPIGIVFLYILPYFFASNIEKRLAISSLSVIDEIFELATVIHIILYYIFSFQLLRKFSKRIKNYFSTTEKLNLLWLRIIIIINITIDILAISVDFFHITNKEEFIIIKYLSEIGVVIFVYIAGYFVIQLPEIFSKTSIMGNKLLDSKNEINNNELNPSQPKYKKNRLSNNFLDEYLAIITEYVEKTKIFRNPELNMKQLSEDIDISIHNISQVINSRLNMNFFNFINSYRIKDAIELLVNKDEKRKTILEIAFEVGFNSKATFNSIFKKTTQLTPTEYRKENMS